MRTGQAAHSVIGVDLADQLLLAALGLNFVLEISSNTFVIYYSRSLPPFPICGRARDLIICGGSFISVERRKRIGVCDVYGRWSKGALEHLQQALYTAGAL
jgi:hypothetical protein